MLPSAITSSVIVEGACSYVVRNELAPQPQEFHNFCPLSSSDPVFYLHNHTKQGYGQLFQN